MDFKYKAAADTGKMVEEVISKLATVADGVIGRAVLYKDVTMILTLVKTGETEDGSALPGIQADLTEVASDSAYSLSSIEAKFVDSYVSSTN